MNISNSALLYCMYVVYVMYLTYVKYIIKLSVNLNKALAKLITPCYAAAGAHF